MNMNALLQKLFDTQGTKDDKGEAMLQAQVAFRDGQVAMGGLKEGPIAGSYNLLTPILDKRTGQPSGAIDLYFFPEDIRYVAIPREADKPQIVKPPGASMSGLILP